MAYERLNDQQNVLPRGHVSDNNSAYDKFISSAKRSRVVAAAGLYSQTSISSASAYPQVPKTPKTPKAQNNPCAAMPWPKDHINNFKLVTEETKWVITDNLPFSMVDSKAFLSIMKQATKGKYNPVSSRSLSRTQIPQLYQFISEHAMKIVDEEKLNLDGVAFTTDIWTSATNVAFQSLTFHFITSQFKIKHLLKLVSFPEQRTGKNITKKVDSLIKEMHLEKITHTWATNDGSSNVVKAMRLSKEIKDSLRCADHQIHLIVTQALQSVPEWVVIQEKLNKLVGHFNHSVKFISILKKIAIEYKGN